MISPCSVAPYLHLTSRRACRDSETQKKLYHTVHFVVLGATSDMMLTSYLIPDMMTMPWRLPPGRVLQVSCSTITYLAELCRQKNKSYVRHLGHLLWHRKKETRKGEQKKKRNKERRAKSNGVVTMLWFLKCLVLPYSMPLNMETTVIFSSTIPAKTN